MTINEQPARKFITTPEAAERASLSKNYIALLARTGKLEGFRIGQAREWFIYTDSLDEFLKTNRKPGPKGARRHSTLEVL
jgi:excisionase family DNA binding protein